MAVYKVPQDVEAEDKLIGPFNFRQFVYLIIVALALGIAWGLGQLFLPLAIIPLPVIIFFGALALPLRKDQPMEIYMAALVSFYLKPRKRIWEADGIKSLIEITVPKVVEVQRTKDISQNEAQKRFQYLAEIVDSQGWAVRGRGVQAPNSAMKTDAYFEAQQVTDILDSNESVAMSLNKKLDQSDAKRHQDMLNLASGKRIPAADTPIPIYNPYPDSMQQTILQPLNPLERVATVPATTSEKRVPTAILNLANNSNLSIEAIAREANRIQEKHDLTEEVVISLR